MSPIPLPQRLRFTANAARTISRATWLSMSPAWPYRRFSMRSDRWQIIDAALRGKRRGRSRLIHRARIIVAQCETHEHADCGCKRHGNQQPHEAEQIAEGEQREHDPDRIEVNAAAD